MCIYTPQREAVDAGYVIKTGSPGFTRGEFTHVSLYPVPADWSVMSRQ
jgi:hypothetical protein